MAKINTLNYQTVAAWNGSQDLFIVEQPDGTKVATPAMVKQYVLAGVTETSEQYAECSTARNVAAKTVALPGFKLEAGARISVRFTDTGASNPASGNITLNVNGTGAKEIVDSHTNKTKLTYTSGGLFYNNLVDDFVYDGTYWVYMNRDNNTIYSNRAAASGGTQTSLCTTGEKYTWNNKQNALTFDDTPTQNSNNPVKSGGIYSTMAVPKYDAANRREYYEGGSAFSGNIDSAPTAGSNNAVASGGTKTYVDNAVASSRSTTNNITISKAGKVRILTFNRAVYSDIKTFFSNLSSSDKPSNVQFATAMRTSSDHKYMTLAFVYISTGGLIEVRHFASYNANATESEIGTTDRVIGEIVYLVD